MRALAAVVVVWLGCGGDEAVEVDAAPTPGFRLEASGATVALGTRGPLEVRVVGTGGFAGDVEVSLQALPEGVSASSIVLAAGASGVLEIQVVSTADNGERRVRLHGESGGLVADTEVDLILPGRPGDLDHSFSADGLAERAAGSVGALAVDDQGRAAICVNHAGSFQLRRLNRDGSVDGALDQSRAGTCLDLVAWDDELVVLYRDGELGLLRIDARGRVAIDVSTQPLSDVGGLAVGGDALFLAATWNGEPGVWKLERDQWQHNFGAAGFASAATPHPDARGRAVIERPDGVILLVFQSEAAQAYGLLAFTPAGELLPDFEIPAFPVDALGQPELHALADGRLWMTDGAGAGFQVYFADQGMTELRAGSGLTSPVDQPARAWALAGHPGGGAVVVGGAAGDLVWTRFDDAEQVVDSFRHRLPMGDVAEARAVVSLPDGRLVVAGDVGAQHVVLRIWP